MSVPQYPLEGCQPRDPNEVMVQLFTEQEIQAINDDPNYYIKDPDFREKVTIFNDRPDEFDEVAATVNKGKLIRDSFIKSQQMERVKSEKNLVKSRQEERERARSALT